MAKCAHCGKVPQFGHSRSHSMKATNRRFSANLQRTTILENGIKRRVVLCARCIKTLAKAS